MAPSIAIKKLQVPKPSVTAATITTIPNGSRPQQTAWKWTETVQSTHIPEPLMGFYTTVPAGAKMKWSTNHGKREPSLMRHPLPARQLTHWDDNTLEAFAVLIRTRFWMDLKNLKDPQRFEDLYEYFDSEMLYNSGVYNMWNLIKKLYCEVSGQVLTITTEQRDVVNDWVQKWLYCEPNSERNRQALMNWNPKHDLLSSVLMWHDWSWGGIRELDLQGQDYLRKTLMTQNRILLQRTPAASSSPVWDPVETAKSIEHVKNWFGKLLS